VVAFATFAYVIYTKRMWTEMRETNRQLNRADLQVLLEPDRRVRNVLNLTLRNTGNVPVFDVRLSVDPEDLPGIGGRHVGSMGIFATKLPVLVRNGSMETNLINYYTLAGHNREKEKVRFLVNYSAPSGEARSQEFAYDLEAFGGLVYMREATLNNVLEVLKSAVSGLGELVRGQGDLAEEVRAELQQVGSALRSERPIAAVLGAFRTIWQDARNAGDEAFIQFALVKLRSECEKAYDRLRDETRKDRDFTEIRQKLLEMARMRFFIDGGASIGRFTTLGDEVIDAISTFQPEQSKTVTS
jgi:hypothetical protein